jgi:hypothetical protein
METSGSGQLINEIKKMYAVKDNVEDLNLYRHMINENIILRVHKLVEALKRAGGIPQSEANQEYCELLSKYTFCRDTTQTLETYIGEAIAYLWRDPSVVAVLGEFLQLDV